MTPPLFLVDSVPVGVGVGSVVVLDGAEGRHAARVKRLAVGEDVLAGDGRGTVLECIVAGVAADSVSLLVRAVRSTSIPSPRLVVVQALPKGDRAELAVEVMTELGVDEIVPWSASRSIVQWSGPRGEKALAKWRSTAREAVKQSRRPFLPEVSPLASTRAVAARVAAAGGALILHEDADSSLSSAGLPASGDLLLLVGPEGGISPEEVAAFSEAGAVAVRLGSEVLRTSTAGAAAIAALSVRLARW